jgi:hypothetical protein
MRSSGRQLRVIGSVLVFSGLLTGSAFADAIQAGVTIPAGQQQVPLMTENGHGYTPGSYAVGTIHLDYTVVATSFPAGAFATFQLNMSDVYTKGAIASYPTLLSMAQNGSDKLALSPSNSPVSVSGIGWAGSVMVTVSISPQVANDPTLDDDGDVIVGKLQLQADDPQLKTTTDILVKIRLVHPTSDCLKVYDFISDASLANTLTATEVNVNSRGKVTSTNPYGSLSQNVMVVNTCAINETFDLRVNLDPWFSTQPSNNPGNAVFTFSTAGEIDAASFNIATFGLGTAQGQKLCLQNVVVPGDSTYLATVHMSINNGLPATSLPVGKVFNGFGAALTEAGASCAGNVVSGVTPNPISAPLPFTIK